MQTIYFYSQNDAYGCFSNFSAHPVVIDGIEYKTTEHYFQAQKFTSPALQKQVRGAKTPMDAAIMGRSRENPLRKDWESVKDRVMLQAVRAKVQQHPDVRDTLLSTGDAMLVEHTKNDSYWADGGTGKGRNRLGQILMQVREECRGGE